jgi:glycosyltransferase involved in cell wall biosynthesis
MLDADIVIDQVLMGAYGVSAVEAMALGKPTICYLRDDLKAYYPGDMPLINADPNCLGDRIVELVARRSEWGDIGRRSREYVLKHHDGANVIRRLFPYYR